MVKRWLRRLILWALDWNEADARQQSAGILREWLIGGDS